MLFDAPLLEVLAPVMFVVGAIFILAALLPIARIRGPYSRFRAPFGRSSVWYLRWRFFHDRTARGRPWYELGWIWFCFT